MESQAAAPLDADPTLGELAALGLRAARVIARMMEIEGQAAEVTASWLPETGGPASLGEAEAAGHGVDMVAAAMAQAVPRAEVLARALDRMSRSVRRSLALMRRMQAGWPRAGADDRQAMVRRQVARGAAEAIRRQTAGEAGDEAAERLFDDLAERLEDPALDAELQLLPVEEAVRRICRDLGLATEGVRDASPPARESG